MKQVIKIENLVLGAGIAGLGAAYELRRNKRDCLVLERNGSYGGLLDNFTINGFRFDKFIHLSFTTNQEVRSIFDKTPYLTHKPLSFNYYRGFWLKHPAQNNIFPLPSEEKNKIIHSFINRRTLDENEIRNYEEWLRVQYGDYFAENFPLMYTKKYWTIDASELGTKWVGKRMYRPTVEEVQLGADSDETPNNYYTDEMRYPIVGGYKSFLEPLLEGLVIHYEQEVISINLENKIVVTSNGVSYNYTNLINTIPLPELIPLLGEVPSHVSDASQELKFTSGAIISLGFRKPELADKLWYYIYDLDIPPSRVYSPSMKSPDNCPDGCSSIQAEYYFDWKKNINKTEIMAQTINKFIEIGLFTEDDILVKDIRIEKYANVIFDHSIYEKRDCIMGYLRSKRIFSAGRFGEWDYFWSDQSLSSGIRVAKSVYG